ncbi:hypothetical protein KOW79_012449 [Hemibagrus wyckioides]|uniref:RRM domain-containing protein n=1 Tax=Hemibagrus wyckioides TaxID=337641 RepID=A0A9D3NNH4_9TELE|nr:hypothetical protein KOW79_012449 [Hemibagrus wyckioides]
MFNSELLLGRPMRIMWSNCEPKAKTIEGGKIFIRNLHRSVNSIFLSDTFSKFGKIVSCKAVESKDFGYIQYESAKAAALAIQRFNGKVLNNRQITIEYFKSREEREAEMRKAEARKAPGKPRQPVCPPCFETRTPVVEPPRSEDTVQTIEASASEDAVQTIEASASEDIVQTIEASASEDTVQTIEASASEDIVRIVDTASSSTVAQDKAEAVETAAPEKTLEAAETAAPEETPEVPNLSPPQKRLTIYILESAALEDQVQTAQEIHPTDANQITWMIVQQENNFEIMNIISDPRLLRAKVDKMDALLKARAAGYKPESLKTIFESGNKKKK